MNTSRVVEYVAIYNDILYINVQLKPMLSITIL